MEKIAADNIMITSFFQPSRRWEIGTQMKMNELDNLRVQPIQNEDWDAWDANHNCENDLQWDEVLEIMQKKSSCFVFAESIEEAIEEDAWTDQLWCVKMNATSLYIE